MENSSPSTPNQEISVFEEFDIGIQEHQKQVRQARNTIFVVAAIQFFFGIVSGYQFGGNTGWIVFGVTASIAIIFLGLGLWTRKKPFLAILIALILYAGLLITDLVLQPSTILKGLLVKVFIIAYLVRGLIKAREAERWTSALRK